MYKDLKHLSDDEINSLVQRYYAGEAVSKLLKEYQLSVRANDLYTLFPPEICENEICEYCGEYLVRDRVPKAAMSWRQNDTGLYCPVCKHKPYIHSCQCSNCVEKERELQKSREKRIQEVYSIKSNPVNFSEIPFEQKVFLGALCRALCRENLYEINPYTESEVVLTPTDELRAQMYNVLYENGIITVSPVSPVEAFVIDHEEFPNRFYTYKVIYNLNLRFPPNKKELFTEIFDPNYYSSSANKDDALELWRRIAVGECIEYLIYQLDSVGFEFSPGEKTKKTFEILLNDFSVSQIYGIIWKSVADVSRLYLEKGISKRHAANSVIGACERLGERAKMNGWTLTEYNRIKDLPQSELSSFFFNKVLKIGEMGFRLPPTIV